MGANHIRVARQLPTVDLVAVIDQDATRARSIVGPSAIEVVRHVDEISVEIDAAVIAVPTKFHMEVAVALAARGVHILVEKPLAPTASEAEDLVAVAAASDVVLAVGHVERFNPAIVEMPRFLDNPIHFEASRISPYTPRISDGVIFDLMIHDIDIVCSMLDPASEVKEVMGVARSVRSESEDIAAVTMTFTTGETAVFNTSRLGQSKIRTLEVTQIDSTVTVDLLRQDITVNRMSRHEFLTDNGFARHSQSNVVEIPLLEVRGEPLSLELQDFVGAVSEGGTPRVDGAAGAAAVRLAQRAVEAARSN